MATHKSAEKRARQSAKRNELNRAGRSSVRSLAKEVSTTVAKEPAKAKDALRKAESALSRAAGKKLMHWRTAARKTSRLAKAVKKAQQASK